MRAARTILVFVLALVWVPLASHCKLETVPGLDFLRCDREASAPARGSGENHDCGESCCSVEFAKYGAPRHEQMLAEDEAVPVLLSCGFDGSTAGRMCREDFVASKGPPEQCRRWHFELRSALLPRAPTFLL